MKSTILNILSTTQEVKTSLENSSQSSLETSSQDQKEESQNFFIILMFLALIISVLLSAIYILYRWKNKRENEAAIVKMSLIDE